MDFYIRRFTTKIDIDQDSVIPWYYSNGSTLEFNLTGTRVFTRLPIYQLVIDYDNEPNESDYVMPSNNIQMGESSIENYVPSRTVTGTSYLGRFSNYNLDPSTWIYAPYWDTSWGPEISHWTAQGWETSSITAFEEDVANYASAVITATPNNCPIYFTGDDRFNLYMFEIEVVDGNTPIANVWVPTITVGADPVQDKIYTP